MQTPCAPVDRPFEEARLYEDVDALSKAAAAVQAAGGWTSATAPYSAVVALGGTMGAYDDDLYAWMPVEKQLLRASVEAGAVCILQ